MLFWNESLIIGNSMIDSQHQELADKIESFLESMRSNKAQSEVEETLIFLLNYTRKHFSDEEALQMKINYPYISEQKAQHTGFIDKLKSLEAQIKSNGVNVATVLTIQNEMSSWWNNHIKVIDKKLADYIRNHEV